MAITLWSDNERGLTNTEFDTNFSELAAGGLPQTASDNRPLVKPSLNLDFTRGVLDPRVTFTRASTATYFGADGLLKTAAVNEPRFEYDPVTRQPKGLLIEEQRTNILTNSQNFFSWTTYAGDSVKSAVVAPDGSMNGLSIENSNPSGYGGLYSNSSGTIPIGDVTMSCFVKKGTSTTTRLQLYGITQAMTLFRQDISWVNGVPTNSMFKFSDAGNGWFRASSVINNTIAQNMIFYIVPSDLGILKSSCFWGAQLEVGAFPTSYIPTTTTQVTRSADVASMTGTNFSSWFRQDAGALLANVIQGQKTTTNNYYVSLLNSNTQTIGFRYRGTDHIVMLRSAEGNNDIAFYPSTPASNNDNWIFGFSWLASGDRAAMHNGIVDASATSAFYPRDINMLKFTAPADTVYGLYYIKHLAYYPVRLTNTQLQELTK